MSYNNTFDVILVGGSYSGLAASMALGRAIKAVYAPVPFEQHCKIPEFLGCELIEEGYIKIDPFHETTIKGVFACGDNVTRMRTVANASGMRTTAGITVSKTTILEEF